MKVRVTLTVDVDPDRWCEAYDCPRCRVREDVRDYFREQIREAVAVDEARLTVTIR